MNSDGDVNYYGYNVNFGNNAVRPALHLNLSSSHLYSYAGTVSSDGTKNEQGGGDVTWDEEETTGSGSEYPTTNTFNASVYHSNYILNNETTMEEYFKTTPSQIIYSEAESSGLATSTAAWSTMTSIVDSVDDPSKILDKAFTKKDMYEGIIFSMFEEASENSGSGFIKSSANISKKVDSLFSTVKTVMKADYNIDINRTRSISSLTGQQKEGLVKAAEDYFKTNKFVTSADVMSNITQVIGYVKDVEEFLEYVTNSVAIVEMGEAYKAVLQNMHNQCPISNMDLKLALADCVSTMNASLDALVLKLSAHGIAVAGKEITKIAIQEVWKTAKNKLLLSNPWAAALWAGYKAGTFISDSFFNTSTISEKTIKLGATVDVKQLIDEAYHFSKFGFQSEQSQITAEEFLAAIDTYFQYLDADCENAVQFCDAVSDTLVNRIQNLFGCDNAAKLKQSIKSIQSSTYLEWEGVKTSWVYGLEEDYPEEYENYKYLLDESWNRIKKKYRIACPVDVYVYDENNNLVASVIGNKVSCSENADLTICCVDDEKEIYFYDSENTYTLRYEGTDEGSMDIAIHEYTDNAMNRMVKYTNVPLTEQSVYQASENMETNISLYKLTEINNSQDIQPDVDSSDENATTYHLSVTGGYIYGADILALEGDFYPGEKVTIYANYGEDYVWDGWSGNISDMAGDSLPSEQITIVMPDSDVEIVGKSHLTTEKETVTTPQETTSYNAETTVNVQNPMSSDKATNSIKATSDTAIVFDGTNNSGKTEKLSGTKIKSLKKAKKSLKVTWKKVKGVKGYQIQYSTSKKFKGARKVTIKKAKITSRTIKKLKSKKKYYVRIRTYITARNKGKTVRIYSKWSKVKMKKTK